MTNMTDSITQVYGEAGLRKLAEEQKAKLLPQLTAKRENLETKRDGLQAEIETIMCAEADILAGKITDYQLRKSKKEVAE